ncbi:phosphatidylglycerophosphatase A family protein [Sulfoacidibacillus thermotolerans]|uniref:Phosphatidylglycerophosphatase A n=1 Tax=Sulfoacidibacillus thermotolerans TaxID=1765684 RepID=A0A2U3D7Z0_SULT2|nr:phosphatidylglycerophosphatase A [Sulfoacidibacillus thermotolerans]PWI57393.1 phosphatidylglycerophosphatase A [Sulfoacidibacillus thermotolerans]
MESFVPSQTIYEATLAILAQRNVSIRSIAEITKHLQDPYIPNLTIEMCEESIQHVLSKREVQNAILTGAELDMLAEKKLLSEPIQSIIESDESLYGVDEILALSILNIYGSIGYTNYGYIDKIKYGVLAELNNHSSKHVHTFMDDLVGAVAAAAASRLAHRHRTQLEEAASLANPPTP